MSEIPSRNFDDIIDGLDIGTVMPMDGSYVLADKGLGQEFRADIRKTFAITVARTGCNPLKPNERATARLDRAFEGQLTHGSIAIRKGELVAVSGFDYIKAGAEKGDDALLEPQILAKNSYLFGRLCGVSYGNFPFVEDFRILQGTVDDEQYQVALKRGEAQGLVLYLGGAMICESDRHGEVLSSFDACEVALDNERFTFYKAIAS